MAEVVTTSAGTMTDTAPYRSESLPATGLVAVSDMAYTKKKVPGFTRIDSAKSGAKVVIPP
jgi:hypothetical protein